MLWQEGYLTLKPEKLSLNLLYGKGEGCQVQYQAAICSPCSCTRAAVSPSPCARGQSLCKAGGGTAAALRFSHVLRLSIIELGGNLGWSLFSEVVICLVFALL